MLMKRSQPAEAQGCSKFERGGGKAVDPEEKLDSKPKETINGQDGKLTPRATRQLTRSGLEA